MLKSNRDYLQQAYKKGDDIVADISKEIQDFQDAKYGEEVRGSMISLAKKLNQEVEGNTADVNAVIIRTDTAAQGASDAAEAAHNAAAEALNAKGQAITAAGQAQTAAGNADAAREEVQRRLDAGEFIGPSGPPGKDGKDGVQGPQGVSGVTAPASGMFSLYLDPATGNLYADYPDGETPPAFEYDPETGSLYYLTGDEAG